MSKILVSALEPSANIHLKEILKKAKERKKELEIVGIFDKSLGTPIIDSNAFNVMGFIDVLPKIKLAKNLIKELTNISNQVDKVLLIDAPSFNLRLAKSIKKATSNKEIIYYILPKVWAWKKNRIKKVNKYIDKKAYIFPFEKEYWKDGIYVGNPLLDEITVFRNQNYYDNVAFLPGSRISEIKYLMPIFNKLASEIDKESILVVPPSYKNRIKEIYGDISKFEVLFNTHEALLKSDFAYICSGTATLEAAIIGTPFVLMYKTRFIEYFIAKSLVNLNYVGLANIIFEKENLGEFHKEFLQEFDLNVLLNEYKNSSLIDFQEKSKLLRRILKYGSSSNVLDLI